MTEVLPETKQLLNPFVIELEQHDRTPGGYFTPAASMKITTALRNSGLLRMLPPESIAWLLFLMTFLSPNGQYKATIEELCAAMHVSKSKAQKRMQQLSAVDWGGWP